MGFLDDLFGNGTEEEVSKVVSETAKKGQEFSKMAVKEGTKLANRAKSEAEKVVKEAKKKTAEAKRKLEIEKLKYTIGDEMVKKGLPAPKSDSKIASLLLKVRELEGKAKKQVKKAEKKVKNAVKTAKKSVKKKAKK